MAKVWRRRTSRTASLRKVRAPHSFHGEDDSVDGEADSLRTWTGRTHEHAPPSTGEAPIRRPRAPIRDRARSRARDTLRGVGRGRRPRRRARSGLGSGSGRASRGRSRAGLRRRWRAVEDPTARRATLAQSGMTSVMALAVAARRTHASRVATSVQARTRSRSGGGTTKPLAFNITSKARARPYASPSALPCAT